MTPAGSSFGLQYPITAQLPHIDLPIGKKAQATAEGLLDTGGACTMGDITYWSEVAKRNPELIAHFEELADHKEKPILIGGVGAGSVIITHVMGIWLPWMVGRDETKLVVGLGENMPMSLLIGLPFQVAAQCVIDIGNLKCHSNTFNTSWKLTLKSPQKKDLRSLDAVMASGKWCAFPTSESAMVTPSPKKIKWDWEVIQAVQE